MTQNTDKSWTQTSTFSKKVITDFIFQLSPSFFPDPQSPTLESAIRLPLLKDSDAAINARLAETRFDDLALHYRAVIDLAEQYGIAYPTYFYHFWQRLVFAFDTQTIEFITYDCWDQMRPLFQWFHQAAEGDVFIDSAQSWEISIARVGPNFHFRVIDQASDTRAAPVACAGSDLLTELTALEDRVQRTINALVSRFGRDYWTSLQLDP